MGDDVGGGWIQPLSYVRHICLEFGVGSPALAFELRAAMYAMSDGSPAFELRAAYGMPWSNLVLVLQPLSYGRLGRVRCWFSSL